MSTVKIGQWQGLLVAVIAMALPLSAVADEKYDLLKQQVEMLQAQLEQVQETLKQYDSQSASKEDVAELKQEVAQEVSSIKTDVAQAAEWREPNSIIHLAGYADVRFHPSFITNIAISLCWKLNWR